MGEYTISTCHIIGGAATAFSDCVDDGGTQGKGHSLLQLAANPISSLCCALVALRTTAYVSTGSGAQDQSSAATRFSSSSSSELDPDAARPQGLAGTQRITHVQLRKTCCIITVCAFHLRNVDSVQSTEPCHRYWRTDTTL